MSKTKEQEQSENFCNICTALIANTEKYCEDCKGEFAELEIEIFEILQENGAMTRSELVKKIQRPRTTIYDNMVAMIQKKIIKKYTRMLNRRGRPIVFFKLSKEYAEEL